MKYVYIILLFIASSCAASAPTYERTLSALYSVEKPEAVMYSKPSKKARPIRLSQYQKIYVIGRIEPNWLVVQRDGVLYYIENTQVGEPDKDPKTDYSQPSQSRTIQTGPRGGRYYINKNGNKTYIKH